LKINVAYDILGHQKEAVMLSTVFGLFIMPGIIIILAFVFALKKGEKR
jgi:hypothetical protein